jgi:hypothetical protein
MAEGPLVGFFVGEIGLASDLASMSAVQPILSHETCQQFGAPTDRCLLLFRNQICNGQLALHTDIFPIFEVLDIQLLQTMVGQSISVSEQIDEGCTLINCADGSYLLFTIDPQFLSAPG